MEKNKERWRKYRDRWSKFEKDEIKGKRCRKIEEVEGRKRKMEKDGGR
jgi:hypothetical protein